MTTEQLQAIRERAEKATPILTVMGSLLSKAPAACSPAQGYEFMTMALKRATEAAQRIENSQTDIPALLAYVAELEAVAKKLADAAKKEIAGHESMFHQCCSNPIKNAWGKEVDCTLTNEGHQATLGALWAYETIRAQSTGDTP